MSEETTLTKQDKINAGVAFYLEQSTVKSNGIREVSKPAFWERMESVHGISKKDASRYQDALDFETTVAASTALADAEKKIGEMSKDDLANDELRRAISATVRIPTLGGNTEVECRAERSSPNPLRGDTDAPAFTVSHGRFRTTINAKGRIDKALHDEGRNRIRAALGIEN